MGGSGSVTARFGADVSGYLGAMRQMSGATDNATGNASGKFSSLKNNIMGTALGVGAIKLVTAGLGVMSNSVGAAVNRFDTLNQYPKVMKQMGYSTQDTNKSIGVMKKGIDGLPTSLQDITKSSQSFAILTGSATKGSKAAVALNDAFLASGASAADASRGTQQFSQMLSTGTVDMASWRTLQETMPYALNETAKAFGFTGKAATNDFYQALKNGEVTTEEMLDKMIELDSGVDGFADTARKSTEGIGTSFTNMKNAVTNGLTETITAIDKGMRSAGIEGGIAGAMNTAKDAIINGFTVINGFLSSAIPAVANAISPLWPIISALGQSFGIVFGVIGGGIGTIWAFNKALDGVTGAFTAITSHPVLSVIIALVAGFIYAYQNVKPFRDAVDNSVKAIADFVTKAPELTGVLGAIAGAAGIGLVISKFGKLKTVISGFSGVTKGATGPTKTLGESAKSAGNKASAGGGKMAVFATSVLKIGIAVGAAALGIAAMAYGFAALAQTGGAGLTVIVGMTLAIAAIVGVLALAAPALTAGSVGLIAFAIAAVAVGAAVLLMGAGLTLAGVGMQLFATTLPIVAAFGLQAALNFALLGLSLTGLALGLTVAGLAMGIFTIGLVAVGVGLAIAAVGMLALGVATMMLGTGLLLAGVGVTLFATTLPIVAMFGLQAALSFTALGLALVAFGVGSIIAGVGLTLLAVGLVAFTAGVLLASVGVLALSVATLMLGAGLLVVASGVMIAAAGVMMLGATLPIVAAGALVAGAGLTMMSVASLTVGASGLVALVGLVALAGGAVAAGVAAVAGTVGIVAMGVALGASAVGAGVLLLALKGVKSTLSSIQSSARATASSLTQMNSSISVVKAGMDGIKSASKSAVDGMLKAFSSAVAPAKFYGTNVGRGFSGNMANGIKAGNGTVMASSRMLVMGAVNSARSGVGAMRSIGNMIGQGLAVGMRSALGEVTAAADQLVAQAEKAARAKAKIHSPSRLMRDEVGYYLGAGVATGIDRSVGLVSKSSSDLINSVQRSVAQQDSLATDVLGVGDINTSSFISSETDADVMNAPSAMINLTVESNWDGDQVRYSVKSKDNRERVIMNMVNPV